MNDATAEIGQFLRDHQAVAVGLSPVLPTLGEEDPDGGAPPSVELNVETPADQWGPVIVPEAPDRPGEAPVRFIDGSQNGQPVLSLSVRGRGWPIPLFLAQVGAVALRLVGRHFVREFVACEQCLSFVADPFPWAEVERFAAALWNDPGIRLRVLPANLPPAGYNPFDYEVMRGQARARARAQQEMTTLERLALAADRTVPTLVDGPLSRVTGSPPAGSPLVVGVAKLQSVSYLHDPGWRTLLGLRPGQRTPVFHIAGMGGGRQSDLAVASWYLKLAGGPRLAPNWGHVRVEVPWVQFQEVPPADQFGFVGRLSRWLIDARCRADSYARMPVSLDPIVRAEEALKPLFSPLPVLVNRLYRQAGLFRRTEP